MSRGHLVPAVSVLMWVSCARSSEEPPTSSPAAAAVPSVVQPADAGSRETVATSDRIPGPESTSHAVCGGTFHVQLPSDDDFADERELGPPTPLDRAGLADLRREAKTLALSGPDSTEAALTAYSRAEDEATHLLDRAYWQRDDEQKGYFTSQFKELFEESNQFMAATFTPDYIAKKPWADLLRDPEARHWQHYEVKEFQLEDHALRIVGPAVGSCKNGLIAFPESGSYRDFTLEMEFTLKGGVDLLFRLGRRVDSTVEFYTLSTTGQEPLKPEQKYTLQVSYIGNLLNGSLSPDDTGLASIESSWTKSRKGAFGVQMRPESELRISRLRIRSLRDP